MVNRGKSHWEAPLPEGATLTMFDDEYYPSHRAVDFYHHWREDIELFAEMGFKCYRMSVQWARIFPNGDDAAPSQAGLDFYRGVFELCRERGIEPMVTISHYELPYALARRGGWANRDLVGLFVRYCKTLFERYGSKVKYWLTFNEINMLQNGSLDELKDALDFAPSGVIQIIKDQAVALPIYDVRKRQAILEMTGFDVTSAIANSEPDPDEVVEVPAATRRVRREETTPETPVAPARRAQAPKYKVIEE